MRTVDNDAHSSQARGFNLRRGRSQGGKRTVDIDDEQTRVLRRSRVTRPRRADRRGADRRRRPVGEVCCYSEPTGGRDRALRRS